MNFIRINRFAREYKGANQLIQQNEYISAEYICVYECILNSFTNTTNNLIVLLSTIKTFTLFNNLLF